MKRLIRWFSKRRHPYEPLITVNISKSRLIQNLREFQKHAPVGNVVPILKANAYGHGLELVSRAIESELTCPFYGVDSYFEALALRNLGIKTPILVIAYTRPETIKNSKLRDISFAITTLDTLQSISDAKRETHIQIKIDTGMHRQGLYPT
jgi:alanine racemase